MMRNGKAAAKPVVNAGQSAALTQQNKELSGKLSASQQHVTDLEKQVAARPRPHRRIPRIEETPAPTS